jgi:hypothetical protein
MWQAWVDELVQLSHRSRRLARHRPNPVRKPSGDSADWGRERAPVATRLEKRTSKMILSGKGRSRLSHCAVSIYGARKKCEVADCLRASGGRLARVRHAISFTDGLERARESPPP